MFADKIINGSFDFKNALSSLYLWLLFGFLSPMINCDIQKKIMSNSYMKHGACIVSFLLLFTLFDNDNINKTLLIDVIFKTLIVYILFLFLIKTKWYFSVPVLSLLITDQLLKKQYDYNNSDDILYIRYILSILILVLLIIGFVSYFIKQYNDHSSDFSISKFIFMTECI